jgi:osmotically-inducible protein OsmY
MTAGQKPEIIVGKIRVSIRGVLYVNRRGEADFSVESALAQGFGLCERCMRTQASRAISELLEDDDFQQLITDRLEEDPTFWTGSGKRRTVITVEVDDGHVTLNGVVRTRMDRRRADILVRALGAMGVDNRLRVLTEDAKDDTKRTVVA